MNRRPHRAGYDPRRKDLARIHMAKAQLAMDDATYRDLLWQVAGCLSAADLNPLQRAKVIARMQQLGFMEANQAKGKHPGRPRSTDAVPMLGKVEALLADAGREWAYAHSLARRMCRVGRLEWCRPDQLGKIIAAMQIDANRRRAKAGDA